MNIIMAVNRRQCTIKEPDTLLLRPLRLTREQMTAMRELPSDGSPTLPYARHSMKAELVVNNI